MTNGLRCAIVGFVCGLATAYFYKPDLLVVLIAFVLGHWLALAVMWADSVLDKVVNK